MNLLGLETADGHLYSSWNVNWDRPALIGLDVLGPVAHAVALAPAPLSGRPRPHPSIPLSHSANDERFDGLRTPEP